MATSTEGALVRRAVEDVEFFVSQVVGEPAWPHQLEVLRCQARTIAIKAGRRAGKTRTMELVALRRALVQPGAQILIISAGDAVAMLLLSEITALALGSPLLRGSVVDDTKQELVFSNGSVIRSVPASVKQIRSRSCDLVLIDEGAFIAEDIWQAARFTVMANPGSQVLMASTPYGRQDRFFATTWRAGASGVEGFASFHWPSTVSPLVDRVWLEQQQRTMTDREWRAEVLAEDVDDAGAFFTAAEIDDAVAGYEMIEPGRSWDRSPTYCVGGIDYGMQVDSHALVLLAALADGGANVETVGPEPVFWIPWLEEAPRTAYFEFIDRVVDVCDHRRQGFNVRYLVSETNGVGQAPTESLSRLAWERGLRTRVVGAHTTARRKQHQYGQLKLWLQQGRLVLPRHPELLRQLHALEYATSDTGNVRIAVPEVGGMHDDVAMALAQAVSAVRPSIGRSWQTPERPEPEDGDELVTGRGVRIRERPRCWDGHRAFISPKGAEGDEEGW